MSWHWVLLFFVSMIINVKPLMLSLLLLWPFLRSLASSCLFLCSEVPLQPSCGQNVCRSENTHTTNIETSWHQNIWTTYLIFHVFWVPTIHLFWPLSIMRLLALTVSSFDVFIFSLFSSSLILVSFSSVSSSVDLSEEKLWSFIF